MAKKRAKVDQDLFASTETGKKAPTPPARDEEELVRTTYYLTLELKDAVMRRATDLGIPASQLALFLLSDALKRFDAGETDATPYLTRSESPKFRHNLETGDWYYAGD